MGRAERRKRERREARARGDLPRPQVIVGDSVLAVSLGATFDSGDVKQMAQLPAKLPGEHRWIVSAAYVIAEGDVQSVLEQRPSSERQVMGPEQLWHLAVGCIDCEQPAQAVQGKPCPAPAYEG